MLQHQSIFLRAGKRRICQRLRRSFLSKTLRPWRCITTFFNLWQFTRTMLCRNLSARYAPLIFAAPTASGAVGSPNGTVRARTAAGDLDPLLHLHTSRKVAHQRSSSQKVKQQIFLRRLPSKLTVRTRPPRPAPRSCKVASGPRGVDVAQLLDHFLPVADKHLHDPSCHICSLDMCDQVRALLELFGGFLVFLLFAALLRVFRKDKEFASFALVARRN